MKKIYKLIVFLFILFFSNNIVAFNSSSYLISQSAFKNYDFTTVLYQFSKNNSNFEDKNYLDELISSIITVNTNMEFSLFPTNLKRFISLNIKFIISSILA